MTRTTLTLIFATLLAACGGEPPATTTEAPVAATVTSKPLPGDSPGKPTVPVAMSYEFLQAPAVGQPLTVRVAITTGADVTASGMRAVTRGALSLSKNTPEQMPLKAAAAGTGEAMFQDIVVTPSDTGRSYVSVQVNGTWNGGRPFTKAMSIPVQVGEGGPRLETNGVIIDDGVEVLSSMPADQQLEQQDSTR